MTPPKPNNADELQLEKAQQDMVKGQQAEEKRRRLLLKLWEQGTYTQRDLAERLSRASVSVGGGPVSENSVFKVLSKYRRRLDDEQEMAS